MMTTPENPTDQVSIPEGPQMRVFKPDPIRPSAQLPTPEKAYFMDMSGSLDTTLPKPEDQLRRDRIALLLRETDSPYAVTGGNLAAYTDSSETRQRYFEADLRLIMNLVGARSYAQMRELLKGNQDIQEAAIDKRALSSYFRADPKDTRKDQVKKEERRKKILKYAEEADNFVNVYLRTGNWEPISGDTRIQNEVVLEPHEGIGKLLKLVFDTRYTDRVRFEAKRKLVLMSLFAAVDSHSTELQEQFRYPEFTRFFEDHVWYQDPNEKKGATRKVEILSRHSMEDYSVLGLEELTDPDIIQSANRRVRNQKPKKGGNHLRMSTFNQRSILYNGEVIPVFFDPRQKELNSRVAKMIRKGENDPGIAVTDATGIMLVARNVQDARKIFRHIAASGNSSTNLVEIDEIEDTLDGKSEYSAENKGSSSKTRQLKFIMKQGGTKIEVVIHTYETHLRDKLMDEIAHDEYDVRRLLKSGSFELLFPQKIYNISSEDFDELISNQRSMKRR